MAHSLRFLEFGDINIMQMIESFTDSVQPFELYANQETA
jgi:hypothetical protein